MNFNLKSGDTIGIISPSGAICETEKLSTAKDFLISKGFNVKIYPGCCKNWHGFAGNDDERVQDMHNAFLDPEIKAIICARGGYGALRILDKIDYSIIKNNPKIFAGSSDITLLLLTFFAKCNLNTFHSQMALTMPEYTGIFENFLDIINSKINKIAPNHNFQILKEGTGKGILWGGNLSTLVSLFGSKSAQYLPKEDIVLFLEDINEPIYKIDKMLMQIYRNEGLCGKIKGLIFGEFSNTDEKELMWLLKDFSQRLNAASFYGYDISHCCNNKTIPIGKFIELKGDGKVVF